MRSGRHRMGDMSGSKLASSDRETPQHNLTKREVECLLWCSKGKTNWEIAQILGLSARTVEHYVASAARRLGTSNRTEAVARAVKLGAIE